MLQTYIPKENSANLGIAILEFVALTDGINIFAETCYILEGDIEIILRSIEYFKRLEHVIYDNYKWSSFNIVVNDDLVLILKRRDTFLHQKHIFSTKLDITNCS